MPVTLLCNRKMSRYWTWLILPDKYFSIDKLSFSKNVSALGVSMCRETRQTVVDFTTAEELSVYVAAESPAYLHQYYLGGSAGGHDVSKNQEGPGSPPGHCTMHSVVLWKSPTRFRRPLWMAFLRPRGGLEKLRFISGIFFFNSF